ncbi:MAG TPA: FtsX-like permease family protein [Oligoflexus sp.]|uniref:ABC transporter permease n=1 Tax=Oligoflexus sp. TaxID=1971216 RepID=UPI002D7F01D7|nr:FtsX-like permease family protein [Oligoflexus sp.]HET9236912.1 FtsX-like permease family protein [Oligoflexus sp.]
MLDLWKVSLRNVGRNKRRSLITIITVFIGVVVVTGTRGLLNGLQGEFRSALTGKVHGDLQIHRRGYQDSLESNPYNILIPYDQGLQQKLKAQPDIMAFSPRLRVMGLLNHQKSQVSTPVFITGIDPEQELKVCPRLQDAVQFGQMMDPRKEESSSAAPAEDLEEAVGLDARTSTAVVATEGPKAGGFHQIMVTPALQRGLKAAIGDEIVLLLQDRNNMQQAVIARLFGVVDYGLPNMNARMAWMDFRTLQKTLHLDEETSEIALRVRDQGRVDAIKEELSRALDSAYFVETWLDLSPFFRDIMGLQNIVFGAVLVIIFVIVIAAIVNTSLMTVMERTREIGTLMALGYRRKHILLLFLGEASVIGLTGGVAGVVFVAILMSILGRIGIVMKLPGQQVATVLYPQVHPTFIALVLGLAVGSALVAGLLPAWRASRMKPVQALGST